MMKSLLISAAAAAALFAAPAMADSPVARWTGFYVGGNVGGGWGNHHIDSVANDPAASTFFTAATAVPTSTSFDSSGIVGGLQLGYNWQLNRNWLIGLEADFNGSNVRGSRSDPLAGTHGFLEVMSFEERIKWFGTLRGRLGYLPSENLLAYITGGFAYGRVDRSGSYAFTAGGGGGSGTTLGGFSILCANPATCFAGSSSNTTTGWTVGGGLEYALWGNFTVRVEYLYVSLASKSLTETAINFIPGTVPSSFNANFDRTNFNVARLGVNYRF